MTYVTANNYDTQYESNRELKCYLVEVVTFDGESYTEEIEARSAEEAQEIAASRADFIDYTMVQGCYGAW